MGSDKARAPWRGLPLAAAVAEVVAPAVERVVLVRRAPRDALPWVDRSGQPLEVLCEPAEGPRHPLAGVVAALRAARSEHVLVVACDLVGLTPEAVRSLLAQAPAVATDGQRLHPLLAVLPVQRLARAQALWRAEAPTRELVADLTPVALPEVVGQDANHPHDVDDPLGQLAARLPPGEDRQRVLDGERGRLAARGIVPVPVENERP